MSQRISVSSTLEILLSDGGTWQEFAVTEVYDREGVIKGAVQPKAIDTSLTALLADLPVTRQLQSQVWQNRALGIGLDYNAAYGLNTRTPGIVIPAGAATAVQVTLSNGSTTPIVAIDEFSADLFFAQRGSGSANTGRVMRSVGGTGTGGGALSNSLNLGANEYMRDLCPFGDGTGARYLYASSSDVNGLNGRLHRWNGSSWSSTTAGDFGTNGRNRMWRVYWTDRGGLSWPRLFVISGDNMVSYTDVGADPFDPAGWIEGVEIDTAKQLLDLAGAKRRVFMRAQDNVFDINEYGESPALMSFDSEVSADGAIQYLKEHLYVASGRTLNRIYVGDPQLTVQEAAAQCFPGWGTPAENDIRGTITAMTTDQGYLPVAVHNPTVSKSYICWGSDQGVPAGHPNPMLWFGPEALFDADYKVTRMKTSGLAGDLRLWVAAQSVAGGTALLHWVSLPIAGAPLQDLISGGGMRFMTGSAGATFTNNFCRLELLPTDWTGADAIADQHALVTRGLSVVRAASGSTTDDGIGTKLTLEVTADPPNGAITWPAGDDVTTTPSQIITPATTTKGAQIWRRIKFFSPNGSSSPPKIGVLTACRIDSWVNVPTATRLTLTVQYGDGVLNLDNTHSDRDPDWVTDQLELLMATGRTTIKTHEGDSWKFKLLQVLDVRDEAVEGGTYGKRITAQIEGLILGAA